MRRYRTAFLRPQRLTSLGLLLPTIFVLSIFNYSSASITPQQYVVCKKPNSELCVTWLIKVEDAMEVAKSMYPDNEIYNRCGLSNMVPLPPHLKFVTVMPMNRKGNIIFCKSARLVIMKNTHDTISIGKGLRAHRRVARQAGHPMRGRYRGQTQSQYLAIDRGNGKDDGKAEAHSAADSSRASVSGSSGMGQAQSQTVYDPSCDDCLGKSELEAESLRRKPFGAGQGGTPDGTSIGGGTLPGSNGAFGAPGSMQNGNGNYGPGQSGGPHGTAFGPGQVGGPGGNGAFVPSQQRLPGNNGGTGPGQNGSPGGNEGYGPNINTPGGTGVAAFRPYGPNFRGTPSGTGGPNQQGMGPGGPNGGIYGPSNPHLSGGPGTYGPGQSLPSGTGVYRPNQSGPSNGNGIYGPGQGSSPSGIGTYGPNQHILPGGTGTGSLGPNLGSLPGTNGIYGPAQSGAPGTATFVPNQYGLPGGTGTGSFGPNQSGQPGGPDGFIKTPGGTHTATGPYGTNQLGLPGTTSTGSLRPNQAGIPGAGGTFGLNPNGMVGAPGFGPHQNSQPGGGGGFNLNHNVPSGVGGSGTLGPNQNGLPGNTMSGTGLFTPGAPGNWPRTTGTIQGSDGTTYYCCVAGPNNNPQYFNVNGGGFPTPGSQANGPYGPGHGLPNVSYGTGGTGAPNNLLAPNVPYGTGTTGGNYAPATGPYGTGMGGQADLQTPNGQYEPGGGHSYSGPYGTIRGSGELGPKSQYGPGTNGGQNHLLGPGGLYTPGAVSGEKKLNDPGRYGQGIPNGQNSLQVPGALYAPGVGVHNGFQGTNGQYAPGTTGGQNGIQRPDGLYGSGSPGISNNLHGSGQYRPGATGSPNGLGVGGLFGPGVGSQNGLQAPNGQYGPGISGGQNSLLGPNGLYGPGATTGQNGLHGLNGQYGPGTTGGQNGLSGPNGQYGPTTTGGQNGLSGPNGQYGPTTTGGQNGLSGPNGQYGPGTTGGQNGLSGPNGQYGPGTTGVQNGLSGPNGQYGPGTTGGQNGLSGPNGQYGPGTTGGQNGLLGPNGVYGPGTTGGQNGLSGPNGQYGPGTTGGQNGQLGPNGLYGPGTIGEQNGLSGPNGQYGTDSTGQPGYGTSNGPYGAGNGGGQYGPYGTGTVSGTNGPYGSEIGQNLAPGATGPYGTGQGPLGGQNVSPGEQYGIGYPQQYGNGMHGPGQNGKDNGQSLDFTGPPQNVIDPNSIGGTIDGDDSQAEASVSQAANGTVATASSKGGNEKGRAQTHVHGAYTGGGSFSAQAEISGENKAANSEVTGDNKGASSNAQGSGKNNKSQANVQLGSETGSVLTGSQSEGVMHSSNSQVQGSVKGGMADAQARGPGSTSSQAQIGFTPYKEGDKSHELQKSPFIGGGTAAAQSSGRTGSSQSQLRGTFKYGITYNGAAQAGASLNKDTVFPNRLPFDKIDVNDENNKNINVNTETNTEKPDLTPENIPEPENTPDAESPSIPQNPLEVIPSTDIPFETKTSTVTDETMNNSETEYGTHTHSDHHKTDNQLSTPTLSPPVESRRSFQPTYSTNSGDYEYTTDKDDNQPEDYDVDEGFGPEGGDNTEVEQGEYANYHELSRDPEATHQSFKSKRKGLEVRQATGGNTQHIVLDTLSDQDAVITQRNSERLDESKVYQPGERVPGTGGYTIPMGFTGSVKSVASKEQTYVVGSKDSPSQAQTVTLTPGSGQVKYTYPATHARNINPKDLRSLHHPTSDDNNRYMSVSKSVTRDLDSEDNIRKQYSHTYFTKSSSCGYFTFTCTMVSGAEGRKKVCKPKIPTNSDGTPMRC